MAIASAFVNKSWSILAGHIVRVSTMRRSINSFEQSTTLSDPKSTFSIERAPYLNQVSYKLILDLKWINFQLSKKPYDLHETISRMHLLCMENMKEVRFVVMETLYSNVQDGKSLVLMSVSNLCVQGRHVNENKINRTGENSLNILTYLFSLYFNVPFICSMKAKVSPSPYLWRVERN